MSTGKDPFLAYCQEVATSLSQKEMNEHWGYYEAKLKALLGADRKAISSDLGSTLSQLRENWQSERKQSQDLLAKHQDANSKAQRELKSSQDELLLTRATLREAQTSISALREAQTSILQGQVEALSAASAAQLKITELQIALMTAQTRVLELEASSSAAQTSASELETMQAEKRRLGRLLWLLLVTIGLLHLRGT